MKGPTRWCLRLAGGSALINGSGFGAFDVPATIQIARGQGVLDALGNPTYGGGPFADYGISTTLPLLSVFFLTCAVQAVGGVMLLIPRASGIVATVGGIVVCAPFWWGFDLPFAWANAVVVLLLLGMAWAVEQSQLA